MNIKAVKNFLYYNWIKIFAVVFVLIFTAVTVRQCTNKHETDLGIMYAGPEAVSQNLASLCDEIEKNIGIADTDSDGIITVRDKSVTIPESRERVIEQQVMEQIQVEIIAGDYLVYIITEPIYEKYAIDSTFMDISDYAVEEFHGIGDAGIYAIPLEGNLVLEKAGIPTEGMYIALRDCAEGMEDSLEYKNAIEALKYILYGGI